MATSIEVGQRWAPVAEVGAGVAAKLFRGLADPTRLAILVTLARGERSVGELVGEVGSSQSNVSGHLSCLKECGFVVDRPGPRRQVFYRIAHAEVFDLLKAAESLLAVTGSLIELCPNPRMAGPGDQGRG